MLELFFLFHATLLGLSYWVMRFLRLQNIGANGIAYFLGIPLLVFAIYLLNAGLSFGMVVSSRLVFGFAILGLIFLFMDRREIKSLFSHPVFYLLPLVGLFFAISPEMIYQPTSWDEYATWLYRPMEIVLDDSILNPVRHGYGRSYDYTPGTAVLLAFHDLLRGQNFSIAPLIVIPLISGLALLGAAYDCIKQVAPKSFFLSEAILLAGLVTLMSGTLIPVNLLVESFQFNILIAIGLCFYWVSSGGVGRLSGVTVLGILCAYAYFVKVATILVLPGLVFALILHQVNVWWEAKNEPIKSLFRRLSIETLILVGPAILIIGHWGWYTRHFEPTVHLWNWNSLVLWEARAHLMPRIWDAVNGEFFATPTLTVIMFAPLLGYIWGLGNKVQRSLTVFVFCYFLLHFCLIVWLMRTMFGDGEAEHLASFSRYFSTAQVPYVFFGFFLLSVNLLAFFRDLLGRFNLSRFTVGCYKGTLIATGFFIAWSGLAISGAQYAQQIRAIPFDHIPYKLDALLKYIDEKNLNSLRIHVIAQGSDTTEITRINFYALRKDVFQHGISFSGGRTIGTERINVWDEVESRESTKEKLLKADVIWIERSDEYINNILTEITNTSTCSWPLKKYFLFKGPDGRFECGALQNPTYTNCDYLWQTGRTKSGVYEIDPDGFGPLPIIKTRCRMEKSGGWTLVASISDKSNDHASSNAVNKDEFYLEGRFGKLSDAEINNLALFQEYLLECGEGGIREIFVKDHTWRSDENDSHYRGLYSIDQKHWLEFRERGSPGLKGFDNYAAAFQGGTPESFMAYSSAPFGCYSQSNGDKPASGFLWVR